MTPRISFVVAARNDDHGGNFLARMQNFVTTLGELVDRADLVSELVVVEWNPPAERLRVAEALRWPAVRSLSPIRIVEVTSELHRAFPRSDRMPMFEYRAKNVGARRARGEYVLATNPDLIYTPSLVRRLAGRLSERAFYRVNRFDVRGEILAGEVRDVLAYCRSHTSSVCHRYGTLPLRDAPYGLGSRTRYARRRLGAAWRGRRDGFRPLHTNAAGDFFLMSRGCWHELRGYPERSATGSRTTETGGFQIRERTRWHSRRLRERTTRIVICTRSAASCSLLGGREGEADALRLPEAARRRAHRDDPAKRGHELDAPAGST